MFTGKTWTTVFIENLMQFAFREKWFENRMNVVRHNRVSIESIGISVQLLQANRNGLGYPFIFHPHRTVVRLVHNVFELDEPVAVEILNLLKPSL